eukprot:COSAG01_NODE_61223_length_290_cov_1.356021_1_plen_29_part_10
MPYILIRGPAPQLDEWKYGHRLGEAPTLR